MSDGLKGKAPCERQEGLADTGVAVHHPAVPRWCTNGVYMEETSEGNLTYDLNVKVNFCLQPISQSGFFWKPMLWTDELKIELFGHNQRRRGEKERLSTVLHGGGNILALGCVATCCTGNLRKEWVQLNISKVRMKGSFSQSGK